jgi:4-amino-4-deoxychorismate lyase
MPSEGPLRDWREAGFHLIETMRFEPGTGIVRRSLHLARLEDSARSLGFVFDRREIERDLTRLDSEPRSLRVRLTLQRDGGGAIETQAFTPLAAGAVWTVAIAATRLDTTDPFLRHKTSRRSFYEAARREFAPAEADEVILTNERGEICEGTITTVFARIDDGPLATPPLASGLLAGVLRAEMLAAGKARETVLHRADLERVQEIFVGNSLRGLIPARLRRETGA